MAQEQVRNVSAIENLVHITVETNSRGTNRHTSVYSGATKKEVEDTAWLAVYGDTVVDEFVQDKKKLNSYSSEVTKD